MTILTRLRAGAAAFWALTGASGHPCLRPPETPWLGGDSGDGDGPAVAAVFSAPGSAQLREEPICDSVGDLSCAGCCGLGPCVRPCQGVGVCAPRAGNDTPASDRFPPVSSACPSPRAGAPWGPWSFGAWVQPSLASQGRVSGPEGARVHVRHIWTRVHTQGYGMRPCRPRCPMQGGGGGQRVRAAPLEGLTVLGRDPGGFLEEAASGSKGSPPAGLMGTRRALLGCRHVQGHGVQGRRWRESGGRLEEETEERRGHVQPAGRRAPHRETRRPLRVACGAVWGGPEGHFGVRSAGAACRGRVLLCRRPHAAPRGPPSPGPWPPGRGLPRGRCRRAGRMHQVWLRFRGEAPE